LPARVIGKESHEVRVRPVPTIEEVVSAQGEGPLLVAILEEGGKEAIAGRRREVLSRLGIAHLPENLTPTKLAEPRTFLPPKG
jgi:hypothetical protein